jgi:uncharacterized RDD family membrane protein YckC
MTSAPAGVLERYAAWSLDAAAIGALATVLDWTRLITGWHASTAAASQLLATVQARLFGILAGGVSADAATSTLLHDPAIVAAAGTVQAALVGLLLPWLLAYAGLATLWHIGGERSRWMGSPGKHALGLRVVDVGRDRQPAFGQTVVRHLGGTLSWLSLNLGHAVAALPPQRRALHDYLAGCRVLSDHPQSLPAWARAWLWLQLALVVAAFAWLLQHDLGAVHASQLVANLDGWPGR